MELEKREQLHHEVGTLQKALCSTDCSLTVERSRVIKSEEEMETCKVCTFNMLVKWNDVSTICSDVHLHSYAYLENCHDIQPTVVLDYPVCVAKHAVNLRSTREPLCSLNWRSSCRPIRSTSGIYLKMRYGCLTLLTILPNSQSRCAHWPCLTMSVSR